MKRTEGRRRERVLAVTPWFPTPGADGVGIFNLRDVLLLSREHDVTVLHLCPPAQWSAPDDPRAEYDVVRVPFSFTQPQTIPRAVRTLREHARAASLVHTMALPALIPGTLARVRLPWVHTEHYSGLVTPPRSFRSATVLKILTQLFRFPTETVAVSTALATVIDRHRRKPSTVIANEVMLPVDPVVDRPAPEGRVRLIGVGGLVARKGPVLAAHVAIELISRGCDVDLTLVGEGHLAGEVKEIFHAAGLADRVRLTGQLSPDALSRELLDSDLFLLPVETETFGVAIAEALTHGLPVVTTGTGGHVEFLPTAASRLVRDRAVGPIADAVQQLLADESRWSSTQIAAYGRARFSEATRAEGYRRVYARAIARRREN